MALFIGTSQVAVIGSAADAASKALQDSTEQRTRTNQEVVGVTDDSAATASPTGGEPVRSPPQQDPIGASPETPLVKPEWASARSPVRQDDVQVRISKVFVGKVPLRDAFGASETRSQDDVLAIEVELRNLSQSRKVEYHSWLGRDIAFSRDFATLHDDFGNSYKRIDFGFSTEIVGQTKSDSVYPGKSILDVLVFQLPIDTAEYLDLELPAGNFGGEGMLRLRIPADMIQRR